ncbi:hypothetical protein SAMN05444008_110194 [Cnuella takakiae]|uniref:Uncharacterized protein n=1 Tax=Cnuella takakiae TaxID=1302690 RepID=A0A1M5DF05_9BACT|nr:hypothetical protein [Cnuella takakiae]OLY93998.1 hypothetical protein BUE76_20505 [Cnuella takakiae]SHF65262.1 hypothetical protein SAMN05444008_110194 [Cnuella takakiae]
MSGFPIVDLVIGMIFLYFLLSIICSSMVEIIQTFLQVRGKILGQWLTRIFDQPVPGYGNKVLGEVLMDHCATIGLSPKGASPNYMDARNFSAALVEKLTYNPANPHQIAVDMVSLKATLTQSTLLSPEIKRTLLGFAAETEANYNLMATKTTNEMELFRSKLELWYDSTMDRLAGTLKRKYSQPFTGIVVALVVICMNADSISIAKYLYNNPTAREELVAQANQVVAHPQRIKDPIQTAAITGPSIKTPDELQATTDSLIREIRTARTMLAANLPLGWDHDQTQGGMWFTKIIGLLATMLAAFMGAPFWFDVLNKIANIRGTGPKPGSTATGDFNKPS